MSPRPSDHCAALDCGSMSMMVGSGLRRLDGEMQRKCSFTDATLLGDHRDRQHVEPPGFRGIDIS
jgi:hypothetical protein